MAGLMRGLIFLIDVLFGLWVWALLLRFVMQKSGSSFYNPITQVLLRLTEWLVKPTRHYLKLRHWRRFDCALALWIVVFSWLDIWLVALLQMGSWPPILGTLFAGLLLLLKRVIQLFFFAILIRAIMSFFPSVYGSPYYTAVCQITEPLLAVFRRIIPPLGGIDFSPLWAIIVLQVISVVVFGSLG